MEYDALWLFPPTVMEITIKHVMNITVWTMLCVYLQAGWTAYRAWWSSFNKSLEEPCLKEPCLKEDDSVVNKLLAHCDCHRHILIYHCLFHMSVSCVCFPSSPNTHHPLHLFSASSLYYITVNNHTLLYDALNVFTWLFNAALRVQNPSEIQTSWYFQALICINKAIQYFVYTWSTMWKKIGMDDFIYTSQLFIVATKKLFKFQLRI